MATELELLAIVWSLSYFRLYLIGVRLRLSLIIRPTIEYWTRSYRCMRCQSDLRDGQPDCKSVTTNYLYRPGRKHKNTDAHSRPPTVTKPEGGNYLEFNINDSHAGEESGAHKSGVWITLSKWLQTLIDEPEAYKLANEEQTDQVLNQGIRKQNEIETPVKTVQSPDVATVMDGFGLDNMSDSKKLAEQMTDSFCLDMILFLEEGTEPGDLNRSWVATRGTTYYTMRDGVRYSIINN